MRVCRETRGVGAIGFVFQEGRLGIGPYPSRSLDENGCRFCGACVKVCPTAALTYKMGKLPADEAGVAPCTHACPAGIDIPRYVRLVSQRKFADAAAVVREKVPFPGVLGQVCPHPCEEECLRGQLNEPVSICALKRVAAERDTRSWYSASKKVRLSGKRVAIVGSGPAGLTAGYYLAKLGHGVTVFESLPRAGGMMNAGIPEYRLPQAVLLPEMEEMTRVGMEIKTNTRVERLPGLFKEGYDAVLLAVGTHKALKLDVPGHGNGGILEALSLLKDVNLGRSVKLGRKVVVIGGGSVAVDAARTAIRLGAKEVRLVCLESREEMPAYEEEIRQAVEEGVLLNCSWGVKRIVGDRRNVRGIDCMRCLSVFDDNGKFNPKFDRKKQTSFKLDTLVVAIGQAPDLSFLGKASRVQSTVAGTIKVGEDLATGRDGVFAAGDAVSGPSSVVEAIAMGRRAAASIDKYLGGEGVISERLAETEEASPWLGPVQGFANLSRAQMPCLPVRQRMGFTQVEKGLSVQRAVEEANRCLQCQLRFQIQPMEAPPRR
jgi:NADPH-dependent glutamate synthase beta subunit-like oxidoreductase